MFERDLVEHLPAELRTLRRREHALPRFDPGEEAVPVEHVLRGPVVVEDGRLLAFGELDRGEGAADRKGEVFGRLVGERQTQDIAREHASVLGVDASRRHEREVHDASRDHGGLA